MAATPTIEERLEILEREVAQMKRERKSDETTTDAKCWVDDLSGSMKDIPEADIDEFVRYCREVRLNEG